MIKVSVPPQYPQPMSSIHSQYSVTNPLPMPSMPLITSPHSAFTQVTDSTHQSAYVPTHQHSSYNPPTQPPQERP
ncbi:unnamed protein product [Cylicocyclus nassatus]|uniref:Uncharacterized protein n=1 Tax=Cylicocyclus nassatus TaxID=53992 RepID=A0AA36GSM6_CYLNA|nr:unnamed protein product [Cylicocyclus nassatus]